MKKTIAVLSLALLAGCASTPAELVDEGKPLSYSLQRGPELAAGCMARNAETRYHFVSNVRRLNDVSYELTVRSELGILFAYAVTEPQGPDSKATVWVRTQFVADHENIAPAMTKGC